MAAEAGLGVDRPGYERERERAKDKARGARKKIVITAVRGELPRTDDSAKQNFVHRGKLLGWVSDTEVIRTGRLETGEEASLLLDRSCFYAEQGGQVGDQGIIASVCSDRP